MAETNWKEINPEVWKPEKEGDFVIGVLIHVEPKKDDYSTRYTLETDTGMRLVWGATVLDDRMKLVNIGDRIRITYKGKTKNKKNQDVNLYKVEQPTNIT
jgi:hypothetical protein